MSYNTRLLIGCAAFLGLLLLFVQDLKTVEPVEPQFRGPAAATVTAEVAGGASALQTVSPPNAFGSEANGGDPFAEDGFAPNAFNQSEPLLPLAPGGNNSVPEVPPPSSTAPAAPAPASRASAPSMEIRLLGGATCSEPNPANCSGAQPAPKR